MTELQSVTEASSPAELPPVGDESIRQAYELVSARIAQVPEQDLPHITLDIASTVTQVLGALKLIRSLRPEFLKQLPQVGLTDIDQLQHYAHALFHLHTSWMFASTLPEVLPERVQRATVLRDILVSQVSALAKLGLVDGALLADLKGAVGHKNVAMDVSGMAGVLRRNWSRVSGKVGITSAELDEAEKLATGILNAISQRERAAGEQVELNLERQRAFKLLLDTYDEVRRGVIFLRWHEGDADRFAPSLFAGRGPKRKSESSPEPTQPIATGPAAPTLPVQPSLPVGHPNSDPFTA